MPSHCRSANLEFSTAPTTDLTRAPTSWGLVVRPFRSRRTDHLAVRTPGVILEAVTTSVFPTSGAIPPTPPLVILHIALTMLSSFYLLFIMRIDLTACIAELFQDVIAPTMFFFPSFHIGILYCTCSNLTHADTKVRYHNDYTNRVSCLSTRVAPIAHPKPSAPHPTKRMHHSANWFHDTHPRALVRCQLTRHARTAQLAISPAPRAFSV